METLTIPKKLAQEGDLVLIPRREYEELVAHNRPSSPKPPNYDGFPVAKRDPKIDREIALALEDVKHGRVEGPFDSVEEFMSSLRSKIKQKRK